MYYIGVDLGGTKILTALADQNGELLARKNIPTEADKGKKVIIDNIVQSIKAVMQETDIKKEKIKRIGLGSPGPLNSKEGVIYETANMPWENVRIVEILENQLDLPVKLENDANAAALGEKHFGAGQNINNMIYVTVSTGIGGGIIIEGDILQGVDGSGGEIGHMKIKPEGPECGCGAQGCLEALASGTAIARMGREYVQDNNDGLLVELANNDPQQVDAILIAKAAYQGDEIAQDIYNTAGYYLGIGLANLINIFNTEMIVFGGGVSRDRDLLTDSMETSLKENALATSLEKVQLCDSQLKSETGVYGAVAVALEG